LLILASGISLALKSYDVGPTAWKQAVKGFFYGTVPTVS